MRLFVKWLVCCGAVLLAGVMFPDKVYYAGSAAVILGMGTALWLINIFIKPVVQIVSIPVTLITLGIFSVIVNAAMVRLADVIVPAIRIRSFWICIFISLIISAGNTLFAPKVRKTR